MRVPGARVVHISRASPSIILQSVANVKINKAVNDQYEGANDVTRNPAESRPCPPLVCPEVAVMASLLIPSAVHKSQACEQHRKEAVSPLCPVSIAFKTAPSAQNDHQKIDSDEEDGDVGSLDAPRETESGNLTKGRLGANRTMDKVHNRGDDEPHCLHTVT